MKKLIALIVIVLSFAVVRAQDPDNLLEFRGAPDSRYRFADWMHFFPSGFATEFFYIGVPGANEFDIGAGYAWKAAPGLTLTPLAYFVFIKEDGQAGAKLALLVSWEHGSWKAAAYLAHSFGQYPRYQVADTVDFTRVIAKKFEVGIQHGFFHQGSAWNPQTGPLFKYNDARGAWAVSYRFGTPRELRFGRVLLF